MVMLMAWEEPGEGKGKLGWDQEPLQTWMPLDAQAGAEGWMTSLNLHLAKEMQTLFLVHTAFCLCCGEINPRRCSLGSETLQQFISEQLHCLQLSQGFSQMMFCSGF